MIDERMEDAYKKGIDQMKAERDKSLEEIKYLKEKYACLKEDHKRLEIEADKLRAQMEIVRLFLGGSNR